MSNFNYDATWLEQAPGSVAAPSAGRWKIYPTTDDEWVVLDENGDEYPFAFTGGSSPAFSDSAGLRALLSDETGSGAAVFANTPTLVTPTLGVASGTSLALSGGLGLAGTAVDANLTLKLDKDYGSIATTTRGVTVVAKATAAANNSQVIGGAFFAAEWDQNSFNATAAQGARAFTAQANARGASGTVTGLFAFLATAQNLGAGAVTNAVGGQIGAAVNSGGGTVANAVGLILAQQTVGGTGNNNLLIGTLTPVAGNWNIYSPSSYDNSILGNVHIGANTAPTAKLDISSDLFRLRTSKTPSSATDTAVGAGLFCWDSSFLYLSTGVNTWRRIAHSTF